MVTLRLLNPPPLGRGDGRFQKRFRTANHLPGFRLDARSESSLVDGLSNFHPQVVNPCPGSDKNDHDCFHDFRADTVSKGDSYRCQREVVGGFR